jgi:hypothetical protein
MRRHPVEESGKPAAEPPTDFATSSVVRFSVPLAIRNTRSA